jgi:hypothetical protein
MSSTQLNVATPLDYLVNQMLVALARAAMAASQNQFCSPVTRARAPRSEALSTTKTASQWSARIASRSKVEPATE